MARPLRLQFAGALYHVTARGNARQKIYLDDSDRESFLQWLGKEIVGHLFQGGYEAIRVDKESYLLALCRRGRPSLSKRLDPHDNNGSATQDGTPVRPTFG